VFHYPAVKAFLEHGFHVVCDKPFTVTPEEAEELAALARQKNCLVCVTYTNMGYAAVKQLRSLVQRGAIGKVRTVAAEYLCDCYAADESATDWRMDPAQAGSTSCIGDIGTHIEHTVKYITGLKIRSVCANMDYYHDRQLENNAQVLVQYDTGASGVYWCSQIAIGQDNGLVIRVYGETGTVEWRLTDCDRFKLTMLQGPVQTHARGRQAERFSRLPAGHTEGFYEAFANIYREFCAAVADKLTGQFIDEKHYDYPDAQDGMDGVIFTDSCQKSHQQGGIWISF
jgi:predicted dehydrogenase